MMYSHGFNYGMGLGTPTWLPVIGFSFLLLVFWSVLWKGLALWHSAQRNEPWWFVALLLINTAGILEIVYLFAVAKLTLSTLFSKK